MPLVQEAAFQARLASLPVAKYHAGETVFSDGSTTGRLLVLRSGMVEVLKDGVRIAKVSTRGAVFGEQAVLLDQPHSADVRTLEDSEFHIADATALLAGDPTVALYVAAILARRLDCANRALVAVDRQLQTGAPHGAIGQTVEKAAALLNSGEEASLLYAGYPSDPFLPDSAQR